MKKGTRPILTALLLFSWFFSISVKGSDEEGELALASQYALIYNCDEDVIVYEKNGDEIMYPASLTKLMTVLVALEQEKDLSKPVVIQADALVGLAEANASVVGFAIGEQVSLLDLLYGAMLPSGADATKMIAHEIAGSEEAFVALMNEKAHSLGLTHTHFANASGLHDDDHYSSVHDIAILLREALKQESFYRIYTSKAYTVTNRLHDFTPTARRMAQTVGIDPDFMLGAKTGFTLEGGLCISFLTNVNQATYLVVLGNASTAYESC